MIKLFAIYLLFFAFAFVLPSLRVWRQTGVNPVVLPNSDDVGGFVGLMFKLLILLLSIYLLAGSAKFIAPIGAIFLPPIASPIGWALLCTSFIWVVIAQFQMGRSWRIGIDTAVKTDLVATGLFRFSRNPIFLGMIIQLLGLFLVQPDALTLAILLAAYILISVQIREEELHLSALHGAKYALYCQAVRRWP